VLSEEITGMTVHQNQRCIFCKRIIGHNKQTATLSIVNVRPEL